MSDTRFANLAGLFQFTVSVISGLAQLAIVARFLPPEQAAIWTLSLALAYYLLAFDFGLGPTLTRELSFRLPSPPSTAGSTMTHQAGQIFATARRISTILCMCAFVLGWAGGYAVLSVASPHGISAAQSIEWLIFVAGNVLTIKAGNFFAALDAHRNVALSRLLKACVQATALLVLFFSVRQTQSAAGISVAFLFQGALLLALSYAAFRLKVGGKLAGKFSAVTAKQLLQPSVQWTLTSFGGLLLFQSSGILLALHGMSLEIIKFDTLVRFGVAMQALAVLPAAVAGPIISSWYAQADYRRMHQLVFKNTRFALGVAIVLASVFANFSSDIITAWIGSKYLPQNTLVQLLMLVFCLEVSHVSLAIVTMATGYLKFYIPALAAGLLNLLLGSYMVVEFGVVGLAFALLLSQLLTNNWYVPFVAFSRLKISMTVYFRSVILPSILVLAAMQLALAIANSLLTTSTIEVRLTAAIALSITGLALVGWRIFIPAAKDQTHQTAE